MSEPWTFAPVGTVRSPWRERFATPRQGGLVPEAEAWIELEPEWAEAARGLEEFSHVWVVFVFHANGAKRSDKAAFARPPRLGGEKRVGVFASRSPFRPNPIGLSALKLLAVEREGGRTRIKVAGPDLLDGTPVLDLKPYVPYADRIDGAHGAWADGAPPTLPVRFAAAAEAALARAEGYANLKLLIERAVGLDPRPAGQSGGDEPGASYAARIADFDIHWERDPMGPGFVVTEIRRL